MRAAIICAVVAAPLCIQVAGAAQHPGPPAIRGVAPQLAIPPGVGLAIGIAQPIAGDGTTIAVILGHR